jgi:trans-aconitate 2-methyltransferase
MATWDPAQYERYKTYRDRPALDLMVQIPAELEPAEIWDLGCGTGEHAALLKRRHPEARVHGFDSSPEMLARGSERPDDVDWVLGDVATWAPSSAPDLIFTNAALQWLPDHAVLFPRLVSTLAPGGVFACQVPMTYGTVWHTVLRDTAAEGPWAADLKGVAGVRTLLEPSQYYDLLAPLCAGVDIWWTTYLHVLEGQDPVVDWMLGTALRPYLDALTNPALQSAFLDAYRARVSEVFPRRADGKTLLPFPRLFVLAQKA